METTLEFTESGLETLSRMAEKAQQEGAQESFTKAVANLARLGGKVSRDGEFSLYVVSFIHYGVIWFDDSKSWSVHS